MITIRSYHLGTPFAPRSFAAPASSLGLMPDEWPEIIPADVFNRRPFIERRRRMCKGKVLWVDYHQAEGCTLLRIYNS